MLEMLSVIPSFVQTARPTLDFPPLDAQPLLLSLGTVTSAATPARVLVLVLSPLPLQTVLDHVLAEHSEIAVIMDMLSVMPSIVQTARPTLDFPHLDAQPLSLSLGTVTSAATPVRVLVFVKGNFSVATNSSTTISDDSLD